MEEFEVINDNDALELNNAQGMLPFESTSIQTRIANRNTRVYAGSEFNLDVPTFTASSSDNSQGTDDSSNFIHTKQYY